MNKSKIIKSIAALIVALLAIRETGIVNVNYYKSFQKSSYCGGGISKSDYMNNISKFRIWPSIFDYIPLYKKRSANISVPVGFGNDKLIDITATVEIEVIGFCSAKTFREIINSTIHESVINSIGNDDSLMKIIN